MVVALGGCLVGSSGDACWETAVNAAGCTDFTNVLLVRTIAYMYREYYSLG